MVLHLKDLKNSTKKLLDLTNTSSIITGYKIHTQKSVDFLYTNNKYSEKEVRKTILFTIASKN
jgi:hypothetical protein